MAKIDLFENQYPDRDYYITLVNEEYTSVCPKTGLPDFGTIIINYIPDKQCLELKALKYYFLEFRDKGIFYEALINQVLDDLVKTCKPRFMEVIGEFSTRGGMNSSIRAVFDPENKGAFE